MGCQEGQPVSATRAPYVPEFYTSHRIDATVVDAQTQEPVEGAVVVAVWRQVNVYAERWADSPFGVAETATDAEGRFTIKRWGPRMPSPDSYIDKRGPELWVLKDGYLVGFFDERGRQNPSLPIEALRDPQRPIDYVTLPPNKEGDRSRGARARPAEGSSAWNGKRLELQGAESDQDRAASLRAANPFSLDIYRKLIPIPRYWEEWNRSRDSLPEQVRETVPFPPYSLVDYTITGRKERAVKP